ncbi:MAG: hypothetical protein LC734_08655 [Acidobacteria bacterium]|nr:hypothetical protein [Acidobacteriota bacterium]
MSDEAVKAAEAADEESADADAPTSDKRSGENGEAVAEPEDMHYQAVENDGEVTAIWEMQGRKHIRTIDPRSNEGKQILALFETAG